MTKSVDEIIIVTQNSKTRMRAIRAIIRTHWFCVFLQEGSWRKLAQLEENLMRIWKFAVFETDFLPNQIVFAKSAVIKPYDHGKSVWYWILSNFWPAISVEMDRPKATLDRVTPSKTLTPTVKLEFWAGRLLFAWMSQTLSDGYFVTTSNYSMALSQSFSR